MPTKPTINRRTFLEKSSLATAGLWLGGCATAGRSIARRIAPDEKMRIGCIGIGGQGGGVTAELAKFADVEIAALCDVDPAYALKNSKKYELSQSKSEETPWSTFLDR